MRGKVSNISMCPENKNEKIINEVEETYIDNFIKKYGIVSMTFAPISRPEDVCSAERFN